MGYSGRAELQRHVRTLEHRDVALKFEATMQPESERRREKQQRSPASREGNEEQ